MNALEQLEKMTVVVADTGDIDAIKRLQPVDATTNPTLVLKAIESGKFDGLFADAIHHLPTNGRCKIADIVDNLSVLLGKQITDIVPGVVSTEVDARLSFSTAATLAKARKLVKLYEMIGVARNKILIKIAASWEGIAAAAILEAEGIHCNLTLIFNLAQAAACAEAGVTLISPFVGRILDWHKAKNPGVIYSTNNDPGVSSVREIFNYYKCHGFSTTVMGASFRSKEQIIALTGCDKLTISPALLYELQGSNDILEQHLSAVNPLSDIPRIHFSEHEFRWALSDDAMANEKLAEGIRLFAKDQEKLEQIVRNKAG